MSAPTHHRPLGWIIVPIIILRNRNRKPFIQVTDILIVQRIRRIFRMTGNKKLASATRHDHINARLLAFGKQCQLRHLQDVLPTHLSMPAMWHVKLIIKSTEYRDKRFAHRMAEHPKHLRRQIINVEVTCVRAQSNISIISSQ